MSDFIIPEHIWNNNDFSIEEKIIVAVLYQRQPDVLLIPDIVDATGLNRYKVVRGASRVFLMSGPNPLITRCYVLKEEKRVWVGYRYTGGNNEK